MVSGGQSALSGRTSRGSVGPSAGLRGRLSRCEMVVGLCPSADQADHRVVAAVCLGSDRAVGRGDAGESSAVAAGCAGIRFAASGGVAPSWTL